MIEYELHHSQLNLEAVLVGGENPRRMINKRAQLPILIAQEITVSTQSSVTESFIFGKKMLIFGSLRCQ